MPDKKFIESYDVYDRHHVSYDVIFTLKQPLSHIGKTVGNVSNLNTIGCTDPMGRPSECFIVSGNHIRNGILRRRGLMDMMDELGVAVNPDTHQFFFSGGRIDGGTVSDMGLETKIKQHLPGIGLLGGAKPKGVFGEKNAMMLRGRINVGFAWLIAYESARSIPSRFLSNEAALAMHRIKESEDTLYDLYCPDGISDLRVSGNEVRRDTFLTQKAKIQVHQKRHEKLVMENAATLRRELKSWHELTTTGTKYSGDSLQEVELARFVLHEQKQLPAPKQQSLLDDGEEKEPEDGSSDKKKSDRNILTDRLIRAGQRLWSRWDFWGTDIEEGYIYAALTAFSHHPYIGGKGNGGCGLVDITIHWRDPKGKEHGKLVELSQDCILPSERFTEKKSRYDEFIAKYRELLDSGGDEIRGFLK